MKITNFGTKIPETTEELWHLKMNNMITYVFLYDEANRKTSCPSYQVVAMLMRGWNFKPWKRQRDILGIVSDIYK